MKTSGFYRLIGVLIISITLFSCSQEELPPYQTNQFIQFDNANDPDRIQDINQIIPLRSIKSGKAMSGIDYTFTLTHTIASPVVNSNTVQASHILYDNERIFLAYNTAGAVTAGGWEVIDFSNPATPVSTYSSGIDGIEYSSVEIVNGPGAGQERALFAGCSQSGVILSSLIHLYPIGSDGSPTALPVFRPLSSYVATDVCELGAVTGDDGQFYLFNSSDFLGPAITQTLADARSCAFDEATGTYAVLQGQPGRLTTGVPNGTVVTTMLGGLSTAGTKAIVRIQDGIAYAALGDAGMKSINLSSLTTISSIPAPATPAGKNPANYVTNGVSANRDGLVFIANGAAGVYVAREDYVTGALEVLGSLDLNGSVNFVEAVGEYLFVATGEGGLSIVHINGLRMFFDDRDNDFYNTIAIGDQLWMSENLRFETTTGSNIYEDNPAYLPTYGRLYSETAAQTACPTGWRLPSDDDFKTLELFVGMNSYEVDLMNAVRGVSENVGFKLMSPDNWTSGSGHTDEYGFKLYGAGAGIYYVSPPMNLYSELNQSTLLWTSSIEPSTGGRILRYLRDYDAGIIRIEGNSFFGSSTAYFSVRCMRDL